jgi:ferredoxin-nitrite reductase
MHSVLGRSVPSGTCTGASGRAGRRSAVRVMATAAPPLPEVNLEASGLKHLPEAARAKALDKKANKFEKVKVEKCGSSAWSDVFELSKLLKEGNTKWEVRTVACSRCMCAAQQ